MTSAAGNNLCSSYHEFQNGLQIFLRIGYKIVTSSDLEFFKNAKIESDFFPALFELQTCMFSLLKSPC